MQYSSIQYTLQQPQTINQMPIINDATSNFYSSSQSVIGQNNLYNSTNNTYSDDIMRLVNVLAGLQLGDMCQAHQTTVAASASSEIAQPHQKRYGKLIPKDYMCHLCFAKDHFISDCPMVSWHKQTRQRSSIYESYLSWKIGINPIQVRAIWITVLKKIACMFSQ